MLSFCVIILVRLHKQPHRQACTVCHALLSQLSYCAPRVGVHPLFYESLCLVDKLCISAFLGWICGFQAFLPSVVLLLSRCLWVCRAICLCLCGFEVCACLSTCPVCSVSLQSADKDTVPTQLFSLRLPRWHLQLQASAISPPSSHLNSTSPLPHVPQWPITYRPSLPCFLALLHIHTSHLPPLCSFLLISKPTVPILPHALLGEEYSGWENNLNLKLGLTEHNLSQPQPNCFTVSGTLCKNKQCHFIRAGIIHVSSFSARCLLYCTDVALL